MKKNYLYIISLVLINTCIYHKWISFSVFTYSDWIFYFKNSLADQLIPSVWNPFGFGSVDIILWKLPIYLLTGMFGRLGFDYNVAEKFIVFWPIIFGLSLSSFFLVRHIVKSDTAAFIGSLVFSYNTYFLSIDSQGHQFLPASFIFATLAVLFFIRLIEENKIYLGVIAGILLAISGAYDLRSLYICVGVLLLYIIFDIFINFTLRRKYIARYVLYGLLPLIILGCLSAYWVLPILMTGSLNESTVLGRQLFGNDFYSLQSALTTFFPSWTGHETDWFSTNQLPFYFWGYSALAIWGLVVSKRNVNILFFAILSLLGIFLSKQADIPFPQLYSWLYTHIPGFSAFREASKFDFLIAIGYSVLVASLTKWVLKIAPGNRKLFKPIYIFTISLFFLWNAIPILTGTIKQLYIPHKIPNEFIELNNYIVNQPSYFRTFWINMSTHWATFDNRHPEIDGAIIFDNAWQQFGQQDINVKGETGGQKIFRLVNSDTIRRLMDISSIKYFIVPLYDRETDNDIVRSFGGSYSYYSEALSEIPFLTRVSFRPDNILVYKNLNFHPHIYITNEKESLSRDIKYQSVSYNAINPSEYRVVLSNVTGPLWLNFSENYHPNWKAKIGDFNWVHAAVDSSYFLNDSIHMKNAANFNSFYIDIKKLCSYNDCRKNPDGSYQLTVTLYFKSQSYLYIGMIVSLSVLVVSFAYLLYYGKTKYQKKS